MFTNRVSNNIRRWLDNNIDDMLALYNDPINNIGAQVRSDTIRTIMGFRDGSGGVNWRSPPSSGL
jgi:hypothetical protein